MQGLLYYVECSLTSCGIGPLSTMSCRRTLACEASDTRKQGMQLSLYSMHTFLMFEVSNIITRVDECFLVLQRSVWIRVSLLLPQLLQLPQSPLPLIPAGESDGNIAC